MPVDAHRADEHSDSEQFGPVYPGKHAQVLGSSQEQYEFVGHEIEQRSGQAVASKSGTSFISTKEKTLDL